MVNKKRRMRRKPEPPKRLYPTLKELEEVRKFEQRLRERRKE